MNAEHEKVKAWMDRRNLSADDVAEKTGYARRTVYWMLRGQSAPNGYHKKPGNISDWVWQRFKLACAGVEAQIKSGRKFDW